MAQICALAAQALVPALPEEWQKLAYAALAFAQGAVGILAHAYTPDGGKL